MRTSAVERIEADAMQLNVEERADLAERLWASVQTDDAELDQAWEAEAQSRMQQIESGTVQCRPWNEVMAELHKKHG